jgi:hypothetical protein
VINGGRDGWFGFEEGDVIGSGEPVDTFEVSRFGDITAAIFVECGRKRTSRTEYCVDLFRFVLEPALVQLAGKLLIGGSRKSVMKLSDPHARDSRILTPQIV